MLAGQGELGHARAIHDAIGKLLTLSNEPREARRARWKEGVSLPPNIP
jgi:hypothetical protein